MLILAVQDKAEARLEPRRAEGQHDGLSTLGRQPCGDGVWRKRLARVERIKSPCPFRSSFLQQLQLHTLVGDNVVPFAMQSGIAAID